MAPAVPCKSPAPDLARFFNNARHRVKMERMNGELRDREKAMRSLKKEDSPVIEGMQIFHNFFRPHMGLDGKTPAEAAGIKIEGENPWITLIQNATERKMKGTLVDI